MVSDVQQQNDRITVVLPDDPHIHVYAELEQVYRALNTLCAQRRIQRVHFQNFQLLFQLRPLRCVQTLQVLYESFGVGDLMGNIY